MRTNEEIIDLIIRLCDENDISQSELARRVSIAKSAVSRYFNKTREFPLNRTRDFADALGVTTEYLLGIELESPKLNINEKKLLINYNKLNDLGQREAIKRVSELTEIEKYTYKTTKIETITAHADNIDEEQINLTHEDIEEIKNWKK